jgi:DsbC/DsbD-like thiol-disulfide interchange protein
MKTLAFLLLMLPAATAAQDVSDMVTAELRPGWRLPGGDHMAALHLHLAPGWKTYWRTPGDAGIPPDFQWRGTRNTRGVTVEWPAPMVFWQSGMRSVGYSGEVVLPLRVALRDPGRDARLGGTIEIGICKDVCIPHRLRLSADLPADVSRPDPVIAAALADLPFGRGDAGVTSVSCTLSAQSGGLGLRVDIAMPGGNTQHGELTLDQLFFMRPVPGYADYRSPVKGLYQCGASSHPGGAVSAVPGHNAAREILADMRWMQ